MSWLFCTSGSAIFKAGANVNPAAISGSALDELSDEVEGWICSTTRRDWIAGWSTLNASVQNVLGICESTTIGMILIDYDMSGYSSRLEAQTMLDVLFDIRQSALTFLEEFKSNTLQTP